MTVYRFSGLILLHIFYMWFYILCCNPRLRLGCGGEKEFLSRIMSVHLAGAALAAGGKGVEWPRERQAKEMIRSQASANSFPQH